MRIKSKLSKSDYAIISKFFSASYFDFLANENEEKILQMVNILKKYCIDSQNFTLEKAYILFYNLLSKHYRNEYIFKNIIFKEVILKNHSFSDCKTIPEFNVGKSKADLAVFNGTSTVYEIKSEIDTTERLSSQINDYETFFEYIYVVTAEKHLHKVKNIVKENIGIILLTNNNKIISYKPAISNLENITHKSLFYSLRKNEYINIIKDVYGLIPIMPNTKIFEYCFDLFCMIEKSEAHKLTLYYLKKRSLKEEHINLIKSLPNSLKCITINNNYNKLKCNNIAENISKVFI